MDAPPIMFFCAADRTLSIVFKDIEDESPVTDWREDQKATPVRAVYKGLV
jgi:hypothetical protein